MDLREAVRTLHTCASADLGPHGRAIQLLLDAYEELNNALCWDTTCLNCASLLDKNYEQYVKLDKIRAVLQDEA